MFVLYSRTVNWSRLWPVAQLDRARLSDEMRVQAPSGPLFPMPAICKIESLLEKFQGNAYLAMLGVLAEHLGVSAASLSRLALGWVPIVEFAKGPNYQGWWVIPERDANGEPVGLSLRSQNDMKVMFPKSKHGLIYEVNPKHKRGGTAYQPGSENWVRTMDAGVLCPICDKPDGCLLSAENPEDPKAVICIRVDSPRRMKMGHLHIRKTEGQFSSDTSALSPSEYPVINVEGMSDVAAAMDLGFVAVGRPSNQAGLGEAAELQRGRDALIVGENDKKSDGKWPGKEGMEALAEVLRRSCKSVRMVMPPEHIKDLRAWYAKYGLTREKLLAYAEECGREHVEGAVLPDDLNTTIASVYLNQRHRLGDRYLLRNWREDWWRFSEGKYRKLSEAEFEQPLLLWGDGKMYLSQTAKGPSPEPLNLGSGLIVNVGKHIRKETLIVSANCPCWLNGVEGEDPKNLIMFANGLLSVNTFKLQPETPDFFSTVAIPYAFDASAKCPLWLKFLEGVFEGPDQQLKISLLQEWFGYCLVPDTSMQRMMFLRGPTSAGKGVILQVLNALVGEDQSSSTSYGCLAGDFGLQPLVNCLICTIPDAVVTPKADMMRALELLLSITAGDGLQVNRKFMEAIKRLRLFARISIAANEFPELTDNAGAMLRRLNILEFTRSFVGKEDIELEHKLVKEIAGIAVWALAGLKRLRERGVFSLPESSKLALAEWRITTSPLASFIEECCDIDAESEVGKDELFDAWTGWIGQRGIKPVSRSRFMERMKANAPSAHSATYERGGIVHSVYRGLKLKDWAAKQYTDRPN